MQKLNAFSFGRGEVSWWISPKVHYMQHFEQQADLINPRYTQCYAEESLMGRIAKIWRATAVGQYANIIQRAVLIRYLTVLVVSQHL